MSLYREMTVDRLKVKIYPSNAAMGKGAAGEAGAHIRKLLAQKETVNIMFAAAISQNTFLENLCKEPDIEWNRVNAYNMDEYIGLEPEAPQSFSNYLHEHIVGRVHFRTVNFINGNCKDLEAERRRIKELYNYVKLDIVCMGIGENGHIAFNDPHVADFRDEEFIKAVQMDQTCRQQQVNDGSFACIDEVPRKALTITIPVIMSAQRIFCLTPTKFKADAVARMIYGEVSHQCPASILRKHDNATLYLDTESASKLND